jgi:hypothetical protein
MSIVGALAVDGHTGKVYGSYVDCELWACFTFSHLDGPSRPSEPLAKRHQYLAVARY